MRRHRLAFSERERGAAIRAGQGPGLRHRGVSIAACGAERGEQPGRHEWAVDGEDEAELVASRCEPRDQPREGRPHVAPVVQERKRQRQAVAPLPDRDPLFGHLAEDAPRALRERLAVEPSEGFRLSEAAALAADEQDAGDASTHA